MPTKSFDKHAQMAHQQALFGSPFDRQKKKDLEFLAALHRKNTTLKGAERQNLKNNLNPDSIIVTEPDMSVDIQVAKNTSKLAKKILRDQAILHSAIEGDETAIKRLDDEGPVLSSAIASVGPLQFDTSGKILNDYKPLREAMVLLKVPIPYLNQLDKVIARFPGQALPEEKKTIRGIVEHLMEIQKNIGRSKNKTPIQKETTAKIGDILEFLLNLEKYSVYQQQERQEQQKQSERQSERQSEKQSERQSEQQSEQQDTDEDGNLSDEVREIRNRNDGRLVVNPMTGKKIAVGRKVWADLVKSGMKLNPDGSFESRFMEKGKPSRMSLSDGDLLSGLDQLKQTSVRKPPSVEEGKILEEIAEIDKKVRALKNNDDDDAIDEKNKLGEKKKQLKDRFKELRKEPVGNGLRAIKKYTETDMKIHPKSTTRFINNRGGYKLGRLEVDINKFVHKRVLQCKIGGKVKISGDLSDDMYRLLTKGVKTEDLQLPDETRKAFKRILELAGFNDPNLFPSGLRKDWLFGLNGAGVQYVYYKTPDELLKRLEILTGQISAGNDSKIIIQEASQLLSRLKGDGVIGEKEYKTISENFKIT